MRGGIADQAGALGPDALSERKATSAAACSTWNTAEHQVSLTLARPASANSTGPAGWTTRLPVSNWRTTSNHPYDREPLRVAMICAIASLTGTLSLKRTGWTCLPEGFRSSAIGQSPEVRTSERLATRLERWLLRVSAGLGWVPVPRGTLRSTPSVSVDCEWS